MSVSSDRGGIDDFTLSERSLYRLLEQQDTGWRELPDDSEFRHLESAVSALQRKRPSRIRHTLRAFLAKRRRYAYQPV